MRKMWTVLLLVLLVSAALVLPAAAVKGGRPPGLKVTVETIDDTIGEWLPWIAAVGDKVNYRVTVTNSAAPVTIESVTDSLGTALECVPVGGCAQALDSGLTYVYQSSAPYEVTDAEYTEDELVNVVTVRALGFPPLEVSNEVIIGHYDNCEGNLSGGHYNPADYPNYHVCRWLPGEPGLWRITLTPDGPGPLSVMLTLRDHVPGNWCATPDGEGGVVQIRKWRTGAVELLAYLPANGVCLEGGHGGELFGDGSASHFYLMFSVPGWIVAEKIG